MTHLIQWPGGEHEFVLRLGQLRALQKVCDAGPEELLLRMMARRWRADDVYETLRQGLIGGGMPATEAGPMLTRLMELHPLVEFVVPACEALSLALYGDQEESDKGKPKAGGDQTPENGTSPASTEPQP